VFERTATCRSCGVLVYFPYPTEGELAAAHRMKQRPPEYWEGWYSDAAYFNHDNFTHLLRFAASDRPFGEALSILDFGGGGGQFAVVCKSHFPNAQIHLVDAVDDSVLAAWRPLQRQIPFRAFASDTTRFDLIFLNDVFEHVSDPRAILHMLANKLKPGGRIVIDTPRQFWLYATTRFLAPSLYRALLAATVSIAHLQIWTRVSFAQIVRDASLSMTKYEERSEYTQPAHYYVSNMGIRHPLVVAAARLFYRWSRHIARNKITAVVEPPQS
jgi:2-polyprenyl-3-methyl-5-hydroxy-6-metoxy-1,4-benzoquinol methylase